MANAKDSSKDTYNYKDVCSSCSKQSKYKCSDCRKRICEKCSFNIKEKIYCKSCFIDG